MKGWAMRCDNCNKCEITNSVAHTGTWATIRRSNGERDYCSPMCLISGETQPRKSMDAYSWKQDRR